MRMLRAALTPNQTRVFYDLFVALAASLFVMEYQHAFFDLPVNWYLLLTPLAITACNWAFGIFSRFRMARSRVKTLMLTLSMACTAALVWGLSFDLRSSVLWFTLVWAPIALPRIFLNFNARIKTGLVAQTLRNKGPVLVVGGGGYIGSHVVDQLLSAGYGVRVFDRFIYGKDSLSEFSKDSRLEIIEGDVTDITKLSQAMSGASAVVHLAGLVGDPACSVDESFTRHANVIATRMLKEVALSLGIPRFIFASSCSVYGTNEQEVDESSSLNPVSLYAKTKIDSERELLSGIDESLCLTILRFATVFGHSRRPRFDLVANLFAAQAMNNGVITVTGENQWRPFVHVKDLARAIVMVLKAPEEKVAFQIFNVGDSRLNLTIGTLADKVADIVRRIRPVEVSKKTDIADKRNYFVSFKKIKRVLGFESSMLVEDGIQEIVANFQKDLYGDFRNSVYSNLEMTKKALEDFRDPLQSSRLYHPLSEEAQPPKAANS